MAPSQDKQAGTSIGFSVVRSKNYRNLNALREQIYNEIQLTLNP